jgi:hypothetical protein
MRSDELQARFARSWTRMLQHQARQTVANLHRIPTTDGIWHVPDSDELVAALDARDAEHIQAARVAMMRTATHGAFAAANLSFDAKNPLIAGVLNRMGRHITNISETMRQHVMGRVQEAYDKGWSIPKTGRELSRDLSAINRNRGILIARTEIRTATEGGGLAAARIEDVAERKFWLATLDASTRDTHAEAFAQYGPGSPGLPLDAPFIVGGYEMQYPGDEDAPPEEICNCRCTIVYE